MAYQSHDETWKEMVQDCKSLSEKLEEMGFDKSTFVVVGKYDKIRVGQSRDEQGRLIENPYTSFGGANYHPSDEQHRTDFEIADAQMGQAGPNSKIAVGMVGSNNGVYAAKVWHGSEMIITKDPEIIEALQRELHFADGLGVPMSNGGEIMDSKWKEKFELMKWNCARKADKKSQELRTAAVQRDNIITTYDPRDIGSDGVYNNVRHYEKTPDGQLRSVSTEEASQTLGFSIQAGANSAKYMNTGEKLDIDTVNKMLTTKWINHGGRV